MEIPSDLSERDVFYEDIIKRCLMSREERQKAYDILRQYFLSGGATGDETPFNKIYPHIDLLTSFLFASETTKFAVRPGVGVEEHQYKRVSPLGKGVNDKWHDSNADRVVSHAITWALVYNTMLVKLVHRVNEKTKTVDINPFPVHPGQFGVLNEGLSFADRQEAMVQIFTSTPSQLAIDLKNHPEKDKILESLTTTRQQETEAPSGAQRLIMGSLQPLSQPNPPSGTIESQVSGLMEYLPEVGADLVTLYEIWIWDDELCDYRVVTKLKDGMTIFDRPNIFLPGEHPFIQFCPLPLPFYFWGMSECAGLATLQEWLNKRISQVKMLLDLQVKPPTAAIGFSSIDEAIYAGFTEGGILSPQPDLPGQGKIERFAPQIPSDIFGTIHEIIAMFADHSGLPNILQGKGEAGVRSGKQTSDLSRLASARIKKRSLVIEDSLEKMATLYLRLMQKYDTTKYLDGENMPFTAEQFTYNYTVKVDAHSNSPIFMEDKKEIAFAMLQAGMITKERAIDMIDPPDKEQLLREIKVIEEKEREAAQAQAQAEATKQPQKGA